MIDIGILGLDTSHPGEFAGILDDSDRASVTAVWDGGDVHDESHLEQFSEEYGATVCDRSEDMIDEVDGVIVSTVDWGTHTDLAVPFLHEGIPTLIDKPVAGSLAEIEAIENVARSNDAPLFGGSAVAFHPRIAELDATDSPRTVFGVGYDHPFYYGAHVVDAVETMIDGRWTKIDANGAPGASVNVTFDDGSYASFQFDGADDAHTFGFLVTDDRRTDTVAVKSDQDELYCMYRSFIDAFLECVEEGRSDADRLIDAATLLLGAQAALETDETITPWCQTLSDFEVHGSEFLAAYSPYY
ncbi:Gfo/Idh/MocA family protein [Halosolutus gelatinilyticus]|uniref:Gfo/Idh/MocA family protein n=1 Tax=Halosolutus gelatinilyticus TaxID=2931975 RepID=UPI001FF2D9B5|nr:Gfo/Idh/MocA family oxidoreductase [Halosolutus gelatinilyticus]